MIYCNEMFYSAVCCNTASDVDRELKNLNIKLSKLLSLKGNIRMKVIGLGWESLITHWSNNVKAFTPEELALHIKMIVSKQQSRSIPTKRLVLLPAQKVMPQINMQLPDAVTMDSDCLETSDEFEHHSRRTRLDREEFDVGDRYSNMQPTSAPSIDK